MSFRGPKALTDSRGCWKTPTAKFAKIKFRQETLQSIFSGRVDSSGATDCEMRSLDDRARAPGTSCRAERDFGESTRGDVLNWSFSITRKTRLFTDSSEV